MVKILKVGTITKKYLVYQKTYAWLSGLQKQIVFFVPSSKESKT